MFHIFFLFTRSFKFYFISVLIALYWGFSCFIKIRITFSTPFDTFYFTCSLLWLAMWCLHHFWSSPLTTWSCHIRSRLYLMLFACLNKVCILYTEFLLLWENITNLGTWIIKGIISLVNLIHFIYWLKITSARTYTFFYRNIRNLEFSFRMIFTLRFMPS